jgi:hypothetical protein
MSTINTDISLVCFKAISNFTAELGELYSKKQRSLMLYNRLIKKTTVVHDKSIKKHIDAFSLFCTSNKDAIMSKSIEKIVTSRICYSQRVFIDIIDILHMSDKDTSNVIWEHLLCISALLDPSGKAREQWKENLASVKSRKGESTFLTDIFDKVKSVVDINSSPMEIISSLMKSGIFNEIVSNMKKGLSDGSLNLAELTKEIQNMVGGDPQTDNALKTLNTMIAGLGGDGTTDLSGLIKGLMGNLDGGGDTNNGIPTGLTEMMTGLMSSGDNKEGGLPPALTEMMKGLMSGDDSKGGIPPALTEMMKGLMSGDDSKGGIPPALTEMMKGLMSGDDSKGGIPPALSEMMNGMMGGDNKGGIPPALTEMMKGMMGGDNKEGGIPPELSEMMKGLMGGDNKEGGIPPELSEMMKGLMGGDNKEGGIPPELTEMMKGMMGGDNKEGGIPPEMMKGMMGGDNKEGGVPLSLTENNEGID